MTVVDRKTSRRTAGDRKLARSWQPGRVVCQNDRKSAARPAVDRTTSRLTGDDRYARPRVVVSHIELFGRSLGVRPSTGGPRRVRREMTRRIAAGHAVVASHPRKCSEKHCERGRRPEDLASDGRRPGTMAAATWQRDNLVDMKMFRKALRTRPSTGRPRVGRETTANDRGVNVTTWSI